MLRALRAQLLGYGWGPAKEHTYMFAFVLLPILPEDAGPVGAAKTLALNAVELADLTELHLPRHKDADVNILLCWPLNRRCQEVIEPLQLLLATHDPVEVDPFRNLRDLTQELVHAIPGRSHERSVPPLRCFLGSCAHDRLPLLRPELHRAQDGGKWRHAYARSHRHDCLELPDLLCWRPKRPAEAQDHRVGGQRPLRKGGVHRASAPQRPARDAALDIDVHVLGIRWPGRLRRRGARRFRRFRPHGLTVDDVARRASLRGILTTGPRLCRLCSILASPSLARGGCLRSSPDERNLRPGAGIRRGRRGLRCLNEEAVPQRRAPIQVVGRPDVQ
mmetsp:Transcript_39223/g.85375  ORF Transcript_39223/g.85375 Transcript_39223/m.85375 type:complete len:333 (-) Transcript_39223:2579-3577(-)